RDEAREDRDGDGDQERAVGDDAAEVHDSSMTSRTSVERIEASSSIPMMRAATRPSRSSTSVDGPAPSGVWPAKASLIEPSSVTSALGYVTPKVSANARDASAPS